MSINQLRNNEEIEVPEGYLLCTIESITPIGNEILKVEFKSGDVTWIKSTTFSDRGIDFKKIKIGDKVLVLFTNNGYHIAEIRLVNSY